MGSRLDLLRKKGVTQFATFVPWQVLESDISHTFSRFLQAVCDRKMKVLLILSPEVGVHYPNSGLPKDIVLRNDNVAQDFTGGTVPAHLPPNLFHLPSYFAPEFSKRYHGFLARLDVIFNDLDRTQRNVLKCVTAVLTGSFWKYYRSPAYCRRTAFSGSAGDYSIHAALAYRQRIEGYFVQKEFADPTASASNRWKTRSLEEVNRRWFYQHAEDSFRHRTSTTLKRRNASLDVLEMELFTPEADPSLAYSRFLQMISGGHADFNRLSRVIEEASMRSAPVSGAPALPFVHWTSMGGFKMLADPEKQFLILKSLLLGGGYQGGVMMDEAEWFALSVQFRNRVETLALALAEGEFVSKNRVLYLTPHLWSQSGNMLDELVRQVGVGLKIVSTVDLVVREVFTRLLVVDPAFILTRDVVQKLTAWAKAGRVVVLPRSPLYTEAGRVELEQVLVHTQRIEVDLGMTYRLHALGDGKLIIYDVGDSFTDHVTLTGEPLSALQTFVTSAVSVAEVESYCHTTDNRLSVIPLERKKGGVAIFVFNDTQTAITADVVFPSEVQISDLGMMLSGGDLDPDHGTEKSRSTRFSLEVPPYGILPLHVEGLNLSDSRERQIAALAASAMKENLAKATLSELPGYNSTEGLSELWN